MTDYYHYTCEHGRNRIGLQGTLKPHAQPLLNSAALVWLTDLDHPDIDALGLTSDTLLCDRTEYGYKAIKPDGIVPWAEWADAHRIDKTRRAALEQGFAPDRWFVCEQPVRVNLVRGKT
jgi:hypothetical protein